MTKSIQVIRTRWRGGHGRSRNVSYWVGDVPILGGKKRKCMSGNRRDANPLALIAAGEAAAVEAWKRDVLSYREMVDPQHLYSLSSLATGLMRATGVAPEHIMTICRKCGFLVKEDKPPFVVKPGKSRTIIVEPRKRNKRNGKKGKSRTIIVEPKKTNKRNGKKRDSFKSLVPQRSREQLARLVADIKPLQSVRAAHPDHGEITGIVVELETLYNRKGAERGKPRGLAVIIASAVPYKGEAHARSEQSASHGRLPRLQSSSRVGHRTRRDDRTGVQPAGIGKSQAF
ncbi:MAG: hypothetical protein KKE86_11710 [Planctomycetes bacterium]|nr:hypothetical protein [Planctomycetota bacterium]MBU4399987.1 hypothetical protein [Planctomycetota bacterium]MCG2685661.1 hypothetical protein [Planctomycetales bacterium]